MSHDTKTYKSPQVLLFFGTHSYGKILYLDINIFHKREEYFRGKLNLLGCHVRSDNIFIFC